MTELNKEQKKAAVLADLQKYYIETFSADAALDNEALEQIQHAILDMYTCQAIAIESGMIE